VRRSPAPIIKKEPTFEKGKKAISVHASQTAKTVLIVEDDEDIGFVLVQFIVQETAYHALLVTNGHDALRTAQVTRPSLLLLDYRLPGMNGIELVDHFQRTEGQKDIPIILLSATLPRAEVAQRNIVGMNKPVDLDELLQAIEKLIH
jgi:CheY-like chemotaxis protein